MCQMSEKETNLHQKLHLTRFSQSSIVADCGPDSKEWPSRGYTPMSGPVCSTGELTKQSVEELSELSCTKCLRTFKPGERDKLQIHSARCIDDADWVIWLSGYGSCRVYKWRHVVGRVCRCVASVRSGESCPTVNVTWQQAEVILVIKAGQWQHRYFSRWFVIHLWGFFTGFANFLGCVCVWLRLKCFVGTFVCSFVLSWKEF